VVTPSALEFAPFAVGTAGGLMLAVIGQGVTMPIEQIAAPELAEITPPAPAIAPSQAPAVPTPPAAQASPYVAPFYPPKQDRN
jgi:hypothetical protein